MKSETCPQCYVDGVYTPSGTTATMRCPRCSGTGKVEIPPTTDSLALLVRCKDLLQEVSEQKSKVRTIEQYEDYTGGEPSLGTCKTLGQLKTIADNATALLADIAKAEAGR